jgi:hypothetical protein
MESKVSNGNLCESKRGYEGLTCSLNSFTSASIEATSELMMPMMGQG